MLGRLQLLFEFDNNVGPKTFIESERNVLLIHLRSKLTPVGGLVGYGYMAGFSMCCSLEDSENLWSLVLSLGCFTQSTLQAAYFVCQKT